VLFRGFADHIKLYVMSFTPVEGAILTWFATHSADARLQAQIAAAAPGVRDRTPIGFFTELILPPQLNGQEFAAAESQIALEGCGLFAPELDPFATCVLHTQGGRIVSLEVYAVSEGHPLSVSSFEVRDVPGNIIDLRN
jgi:hypothetical protein